MGDKYVKNVADSYERTWQDGRPVNPATRDVFERITQQPPLVDPAVNEDIRIRNEVGRHITAQNPPKAKGFLDDLTSQTAKKIIEAGVAAGAAALQKVKAPKAGWIGVGTAVGSTLYDHGNEFPEAISNIPFPRSIPGDCDGVTCDRLD